MSNNNDLIGRRLSFQELFKANNFIIEIPTIQRDYAQGRKNKSEVRDLFLQALLDYLEENKPERDLDFVYGSTEKLVEETKFVPLDGQQRLTTLFLLHWYLATLSGNSESFKELMLQNGKSRFTYLTRPSSSEFVNALVANEIDFENLLVSKDTGVESLSATINDKGWFYLSWSYDPTIQSMLTMLDAIHNKFKDKSHFYERLINQKSPIITFQYLNLKEFSLTEDLYIKMNSRGKPLTSFENFKAKLEQHISSLFGELDKPFVISTNKFKASYKEYFSFQIDTHWANLFWQYKHLVGKPYTFDEELMNFIRVIIANQFAIENFDNVSAFKELINTESATSELSENISFYKFKSLGALSKNCIKYLIESFDVLGNESNKIHKHFEELFYFNEELIFEKALKCSLSMPERAMFHAYVRYLIVNKKDKTNIFQWMRVISNLIENSRIDDEKQLINIINSIEKLLDYSENILKYLVSNKCKIDHFPSWQIEEEIIKAHLILKSTIWQDAIEKYEKLVFHKGQIGYLLEFSNILEYYKINNNLNWGADKDLMYLNSFINYSSKSVALFGFFETKSNTNYLLERALLTKGDYLIWASANRYNFCSSKKVSNYQRDFSWKRLLRFTIDDVEHWKEKRDFLKDLLDDSNFDMDDVKNSLTKICLNVPDDWRSYFVENSDLIDYCQQGFISYTSDSEIELYKESQLNHYHTDMFVYYIYLTYIKDNSKFYEPFQEEYLIPTRGNDDVSFVLLENWSFRKKQYCIKIYRDKGDYEIGIEKSKGNKNEGDFNEEIIEIINERKFKWDDEYKLYYKRSDSEKSIISSLKNLLSDLKNLSNE